LVWWFSVRTDEPPPLETGLLGLLWMLPFPLTFLVQAMGLPVTEIVMIALYSALTVRAMAPERVKNPPALAPAGS
jgi:hypothetical protein